jgi:hypothetical protein
MRFLLGFLDHQAMQSMKKKFDHGNGLNSVGLMGLRPLFVI